MKIHYWVNELYIELKDHLKTDITIKSQNEITIKSVIPYYAPAAYVIQHIDICELLGFMELWNEVYGNKEDENG